MHLALAPRRRLAALAGSAAPELLAALDAALAARAAAGIASLAYDPEVGVPALGLPPAPLEPAALISQVKAADRALAACGEAVESLWIVGGPRALPFAGLPNPMPDRDGPLRTDAPYGLAGPDELIPRWPVGRTPDADPPVPGLLAALLRAVAAAHVRAPRCSTGGVVALGAARWAAVTAEVLANAGPALVLSSPPIRSGSAELGSLAGARVVYCNLHGVRGRDAWFGQAPGDSELVPALHPADLAGLRLDGAVVITQACFGARLAAVEDQLPLAVTLLRAGATALFGAIGLTYGAPELPPGESDLLAAALLSALRRPGVRLGEALLMAQISVLRTALRRQGALDPDEVKTLLGFMLYGDPALSLEGSE
ncbi:MAG: hypothetical protein OHK0015_33180 [Chloroflexi bacterium OHK40]